MQCSQVLPTRPQLVHLESVACLCESRRGGTLMKLQPKPQQASRNFIFAFAAGGTSMCNCNGHCHSKCNSNNFNCNKCNWHCECNKVSATGYDLPFKARKWNLVSHFSLLFGFCTNAPFFAFCVWSVSQSNCNVFSVPSSGQWTDWKSGRYLHNYTRGCRSDSKIKLDREAYLQAKEICEKVNKENKFIMHATDKRVSPLKRCGK